MLKYNDVIVKLSDEQKIRILSGVGNISGKDMKNLGIPSVRRGNMKDYDRNLYPHSTSISHAWNTTLWREVSLQKTQKMAQDGVNFLIAPGAKIKLSPYRKEISEDPYLSSAVSAAYLKAAADAGAMVGASGYYITESDVEWLDETPNDNVIRKYVVDPYKKASTLSHGTAIITDIRLPSEEYKDTCENIQREVVGDSEFLVCFHANEDNTVKLISNGVICFDGSENALKAALTRYRKLSKRLAGGENIDVIQIEDEIARGEAISDEKINEALDRTLDFIFRCANKIEKNEEIDAFDEDELALRSTVESTVLLKNKDGILPIGKGKKILIVDCVSGEREPEQTLGARCASELTANGINHVDWIKGCSELECYAETEVKSILSAVAKADVVLLLVSSGYETERRIYKTEKLTLPNAQVYLADKISARAKKSVAIMLSEHAPDVEFAYPFDALLLTPLEIKHSANAIAKIITGKCDAGGRLAYTLYSGSETSLRKGIAYKRSYGMKSGEFIGYRYYDSADMRVGYPFGHGLSYAKFVYSKLSVSENEVSFTIKNAANVRGCEVAQIYAGINSSAALRPKKELCGFAKIELEPFEQKRISVKIELPRIYKDGVSVYEKGSYTVYVGSSVSNIRLSGRCVAGDAVLSPDGERRSDYLQTSTNVLNDKYVLEADYSLMKKGIKNILTGVVSVALAITLEVFNMTTGLNSMVLGIIAGILALFAVVFFIIDVVEKSKRHAEQIKKISAANKDNFKDAEQIPVLSTEQMFKDNFDDQKEEHHKVKEEVVEVSANFDAEEEVAGGVRIKDAVSEFNKFAAERGYKMGSGVAENLLSAISASRLLVINGLTSEQFNSFILLVSEYFGTSMCIDNSTFSKKQSSKNSGNVFVSYDHEGEQIKKNIFKALGNAVNQPLSVHIAAIDQITSENATEWMAPLMRYVRYPKKRNEIAISDGAGKMLRYNIPRNLWIVLRLDDKNTIDELPTDVIRCASVVSVNFTKCQVSDDHMIAHGFTAQQADYMLEKESVKAEIPEGFWKKLDKLEKYAADYTDYNIGNRLWLDFEKQLGMLLATGMEINDAGDAAIAARILPSITIELRGKLKKEDKTVYQSMEFIFGADNLAFSKAYIDSLKLNERGEESKAEDDSAKTNV